MLILNYNDLFVAGMANLNRYDLSSLIRIQAHGGFIHPLHSIFFHSPLHPPPLRLWVFSKSPQRVASTIHKLLSVPKFQVRFFQHPR